MRLCFSFQLTIHRVLAGACAHRPCPCTAACWHAILWVCMNNELLCDELRYTSRWLHDMQPCKGDGNRRVSHCHLESALHRQMTTDQPMQENLRLSYSRCCSRTHIALQQQQLWCNSCAVALLVHMTTQQHTREDCIILS